MKRNPSLNLIWSVALGAAATLLTGRAATVVLPSEAAGALGTSTTRGLIVRTAQAPDTNVVGNSLVRALKQLNGTLTDPDGNPVPNEAIAGTDPGGVYFQETVNYEKDGAPIDVTDPSANILASFGSGVFPGIPGTGGHTSNFVAEVVGFVELSAGTHTFGISVGADRTDANDDDGYQVFVGANPRDYFNLSVAAYERIAQGFVGDQHIENQFTVEAPVTGIYPFRIVYWQTGHGANLQWYTVNTNTQERILVNDSSNPNAIKAYRDSSIARANAPYVGEVSPNPGSSGNSSAAPIEAVLVDGVTTVNTNSIELSLNGAPVVPQTLAKSGGTTTIAYPGYFTSE